MKYILLFFMLFYAQHSQAGFASLLAQNNKRQTIEDKKVSQETLSENNDEQQQLNPAQIYEKEMLSKKQQNYQPRNTNKRTSGRSPNRNFSNNSKSSKKSSKGGSSRGLPSVSSGMFVK